MKIYVAGPYTLGNIEENVQTAIDAGRGLLALGHFPYIPHLSHYIEMREKELNGSGLPYTLYLGLDLVWLAECDALLRLPGESRGAEIEEAFARGRNLLIGHSVEFFRSAI